MADDDEAWCSTLEELLTGHGLSPVVAHCGSDAIALARKQPLPLSILDVHLSDMTGFDIFRSIRSLWENHRCIFVTADESPEVRTQARHLGAWSLLIKPVDGLRLAITVREMLDMFGSRKNSPDGWK